MSIFMIIYSVGAMIGVVSFFWWMAQPETSAEEARKLFMGKSALTNFTENIIVMLVALFLWPLILAGFTYLCWKSIK